MSFSFIWSPQTHKTVGGYYINHDNLMLASPEERKKLILYFIGCQTPEKMDPKDRELFLKEKQKSIDIKSHGMGVLWAAGLGLFPQAYSKYNGRPFLNASLKIVGLAFFYYLGYNVTYGLSEPKFVNRNSLVEELSEKYSFSVFDFAQAKKESHLKELRKELTSESSNLFYS